jgi:hypothetical protein
MSKLKDIMDQILSVEKELLENKEIDTAHFVFWPLIRLELFWNLQHEIVPKQAVSSSCRDHSARLLGVSESGISSFPNASIFILSQFSNFKWKTKNDRLYDVRFGEIIRHLNENNHDFQYFHIHEDGHRSTGSGLENDPISIEFVLDKKKDTSNPIPHFDETWKALGLMRDLANKFMNKEYIGLSMVKTFFSHINAWNLLLNSVRPKFLFLDNFYNPIHMALVYAARKRKIKVIDVAHGTQGPHHGMYSHWINPKLSGSPVLPDRFWVWGKEAQRDVEDNSCLTELRGEKVTVLGGNPALKRFRGITPDALHKKYEEEFAEYLPDESEAGGKIGLVTCGHDWRLIPAFVFDCLGQLDDWLWLFRFHPHSSGYSVEEANAELDAKNLSNCVTMSPDSLPMPFLLSKVDLHLTGWSTTCREASIFEVPTIFFDQRATSFYQKEISEGHFLLSMSEQSLSLTIDRAFRQGFVRATQNHIETSSHFTRNALEEIFKN